MASIRTSITSINAGKLKLSLNSSLDEYACIVLYINMSTLASIATYSSIVY